MNQYKTLICKCLTIRYTVCHHVAPQGICGKPENGGKGRSKMQKPHKRTMWSGKITCNGANRTAVA